MSFLSSLDALSLAWCSRADTDRKQIAPIADRYRSSIYRKVRIADVVDIKRLSSSSLRKYALMAHLDFVVADENEQPLFAVEFDGPGHSPSHDAEKDEIFRLADLALFRVDLRSSRLETAQLSLLEYLVHLWFLGNQFREMRATGGMSADEAFMMSGFLRSDAKNIFDSEFDLLGSARSKLYSDCKKNDLPGGPHLLASVLLAEDDSRYIAFLQPPSKRHEALWSCGVWPKDTSPRRSCQPVLRPDWPILHSYGH